MKSMKPSELLKDYHFAVVRFYVGIDFFFIAGAYLERVDADKECDRLNITMRVIYGEDKYEVVEISHDS